MNKHLKAFATFVESISSLIELIKLVLMVVVVIQALSFGTLVINKLDTVNQGLSQLVGGIGGASDKVKEIGDKVASGEFTEKADQITDNVVDAKNNFLEKFKKKDE